MPSIRVSQRVELSVRRLVLSIASVIGLSASALAGPGTDFSEFAADLREQADERAVLAASTPAAPAQPLDIEDPFYFELEQFSVDAMRLSRAIAQADGPQDLQCIFRGMSEDAADRLEALNEADSSGDQARIYRNLSALLRDAEEIAPAVDDAGVELSGMSCSNG
ncbi:hypothetical protein [Maricaulis sp. MIT060901]|uniref:hypothetical protein n=1 Tax=Maricaulis sp. MIT060901 TaxID=3096993 RepID=UPI0039997DA9